MFETKAYKYFCFLFLNHDIKHCGITMWLCLVWRPHRPRTWYTNTIKPLYDYRNTIYCGGCSYNTGPPTVLTKKVSHLEKQTNRPTWVTGLQLFFTKKIRFSINNFNHDNKIRLDTVSVKQELCSPWRFVERKALGQTDWSRRFWHRLGLAGTPDGGV